MKLPFQSMKIQNEQRTRCKKTGNDTCGSEVLTRAAFQAIECSLSFSVQHKHLATLKGEVKCAEMCAIASERQLS